MIDADQTTMNQVAREWLTARDVIAKSLLEMIPRHFEAQACLSHDIAAAILTRLAHAGILIQSQADAERQEKARADLLAILKESAAFWSHYAMLNEDAQFELGDEKAAMENKVAAAIAAAENTP